jgi:hypothetical protein
MYSQADSFFKAAINLISDLPTLPSPPTDAALVSMSAASKAKSAAGTLADMHALLADMHALLHALLAADLLTCMLYLQLVL